MRRLTLLAAMAAVLLSLSASFVLAAGDDAAGTIKVTNKRCPVMNDDASVKYRTEYEGQYVYFCCSGCVDMFKADPKAAIAKMSDEDRAAIQKNTVCPVSGEKIEKFDVRSEYEGKFVYFCCEHCKTSFDKEHAGAK